MMAARLPLGAFVLSRLLNKWPNHQSWNYLVSVARLLIGSVLGTNFRLLLTLQIFLLSPNLHSLLHEDAKSAIEGLSLTGDHYSIACDIFCNRYEYYYAIKTVQRWGAEEITRESTSTCPQPGNPGCEGHWIWFNLDPSYSFTFPSRYQDGVGERARVKSQACRG